MSRRFSILIPLLGTSFLGFTTSVTGQTPAQPSPFSPETVLGRSASTVARIVAFGANSYRMKLAVDTFQIFKSGVEELTSKAKLEEALLRSELVGVKPVPLPTTVVSRKPAMNSEIAVLQRTFRKLTALGLHEEAAEIAALIANPELQGPQENGVVNALAVEKPNHGSGIQQAVFESSNSTSWSTASKSLVSCRFEGVSLEAAAKHIQTATGCNVCVRAGGRPLPQVHFSCQNLAADKALDRLVESCGWTYQISGQGVELVRPTAFPLRGDRLPILR